MNVADRLTKLADLNRERGGTYGDFEKIGRVLAQVFPEGLTLKTPDDWNRIILFTNSMNKLVRYSVNFNAGGHADSLDDNAVYSIMLRDLDARNGKE